MAKKKNKQSIWRFLISLIMGHTGSYFGWSAILWNLNMGEWNMNMRMWAVIGGLISSIILFLAFFVDSDSSHHQNDTQFYDDYD